MKHNWIKKPKHWRRKQTEYVKYRTEIAQSNLATLQMIGFVGMIASIPLTIASLPCFHLLQLFSGYVTFAILFTAIYISTKTLLVKHHRLILPVYYSLYIVALSVGIVMGTIWGKSTNATTFVMIVLVFPLFIIDKPHKINLITVFASAVFLLLALRLKSGMILRLDVGNGVVFCLLSCFLCVQSVHIKMRDINNTQEYEYKLSLENALKTSEAANQAKTEFLSRMSHDIRTPMNAIIGMTKLAQDENNTPQTAEYLENINSSSQFLLGLINDILDLSKIESGQLALQIEPCSVKEFEKSVNTVIRPLMKEKNIEFIFELNCGITCMMLDRLRFSQIFFNLLSNAVKFTPQGGKIEFIAEPIEPKNGLAGVRYLIRDNGMGMSEAYMPHMFEPFSQEKTRLTADQQGTGLGLPIVKSLVEAMNGTIQVRSELGKGTEFILELYAQSADEEQLQKVEKQRKSSLAGSQILLVEDNDLNIMVARRLLEKEGCIVTVCKNGEEAVKTFSKAETGFFDAILMDIRMPVMDGLTATMQIRDLKRVDAETVPIIAMTADAFADEQKRTLVAGMNAHLAKPIDPERLYDTICELL